MVGLNDARTAHHPATVELIRSLRPDIITYHHAGTLDLERLAAIRHRPAGKAMVPLSNSALLAAVPKRYRPYLHRSLADYAELPSPTKAAAVTLTRFLGGRPHYDVYAVRYGDGFKHIYGVRHAWHNRAPFIEALSRAHGLPYLPYIESKGLVGEQFLFKRLRCVFADLPGSGAAAAHSIALRKCPE